MYLICNSSGVFKTHIFVQPIDCKKSWDSWEYLQPYTPCNLATSSIHCCIAPSFYLLPLKGLCVGVSDWPQLLRWNQAAISMQSKPCFGLWLIRMCWLFDLSFVPDQNTQTIPVLQCLLQLVALLSSSNNDQFWVRLSIKLHFTLVTHCFMGVIVYEVVLKFVWLQFPATASYHVLLHCI